MAEKITLASIAAQIEKGFGAVATDIADIKRDMATKDQIIALQVPSQDWWESEVALSPA